MAGVPMGRRAVDALRVVTAEVGVVGADADVGAELGVEARPDLRAGGGPLAGLETALHWAAEAGLEGVLLLGCDLPLVGPETLRVLVERWSDQDAVVPWGEAGPEPVCGLYRTGLLEEVGPRLDRGAGALHALVDDLRVLRVPPEILDEAQGRRGVLLNVNTPTERMRAEARLAPGPPVVCVVGKKNSGKTALTVALVAELGRRGRRVMSVKHGHGFELDRPGTDSWRHRREGGAERVLLVGPEDLALLGGWGPGGERPLRELVDRHLAEADIVVAEGWKSGPEPKVEVYRAAAHPDPLYDPGAPAADTFLAVLTDRGDYRPGLPVHSLDDPDHVARIADRIEEVLLD